MTVKLYEICHRDEPSRFAVSENGVWVEGLYDSRESALTAIDVDPTALAELWAAKKVLYGDHAILTVADMSKIKEARRSIVAKHDRSGCANRPVSAP